MLTSTLRRYTPVFVTVGFFFGSLIYFCFRESRAISVNHEVQTYLYDITGLPVMLGQINPNRKYAVFSSTSAKHAESLDFIFTLPLTALAWKRIGFDSVVIVVGPEDLWNSDPLLYVVLRSLRQLDAVVIFLDVHPANSVMVSQVTLLRLCIPCYISQVSVATRLWCGGLIVFITYC